MEAVQRLLELMPMLDRKEYPPIGIGQRAIISFYNAASDEDKLTATKTLREILHQIDRS